MSIKHLYPNSTPALNLNFKSSRVADPRISCTRSTTATYVDPVSGLVKTAAANEARVEKGGLLVEESRTNEEKYSAEFADNSRWNMKNSYTRGSNTTEPAPDGTNTACEFFEVNGAGQFNGVKAASMYQITASSGRLTVSVFNKPINNDTFMLMESDTTSGVANCTSIINNTWQYNSSFVESAKSEPVGNGWYRMSATFIVPTSTQWYRPVFSSQMYSGPNETPDATQGCTLWGAQVEEGTFVTSYIPTSGSTVTRTVDLVKISGTDFSNFFNNSQGTFVARLPTKTPAVAFIADVGNNSTVGSAASGYILQYVPSSNNASGDARVNDGSVAFIEVSATGSHIDLAFAYEENNFNAAVNGTLGTTDTSGGLPTLGAQQVVIGSRFNSQVPNNVPMSNFSYYPTRLINSQLQALTT